MSKVFGFLKRVLTSKVFWGLAVLAALFVGLYKMNAKRVEGDEAIRADLPKTVATEVTAQLTDPATVDTFRGDPGPEGPQGSIGMTGEDGAPGSQGEPGICPNCATTNTATATTSTPDPTSVIAKATPQVLVYQPVTVNGRGTPAGKIPTGGGWTITNNGTAIIAPVTVN